MIAVLACTASNAQAQLIAGRTNALLWGNLTPNFSLELVTSNRTSVMAGAFYSLDQNPLDCSIKGAEAQVRYWVSGRAMVQSFIGLGIQGMRYDATFSDTLRRCRRPGNGVRICTAAGQTLQHRIQRRNITDVVQGETLREGIARTGRLQHHRTQGDAHGTGNFVYLHF